MGVTRMTDALRDVFRVVADVLEPSGIDCLLVGGFAVNHYGYSRSTLDVDFMIVADKQDAVRDAMRKAGFTSYSIHETVMFLQRPGSVLRVDFLKVDVDTMSQLISRAESATILGATVKIPALKDLLAMKLFSLAQNPERRMGKDLPDIVQLCFVNGLDLERDIHPLAIRYANEVVFKQVSEQVRALS
jgi:hypothetical protein